MIHARFFSIHDNIVGFEFSGHALAAPYGEDILCAAVSAAVTYAECLINDLQKARAAVTTDHDKAMVRLELKNADKGACDALRALYLYMNSLQSEHQENIKVEVTTHA